MDDKDHWAIECNTCTRTFQSEHAKEQHMTAVGHWYYRRSPASRATVSAILSDDYSRVCEIEGKATNETVEATEVLKANGMNNYQHRLTSCIARYVCRRMDVQLGLTLSPACSIKVPTLT